MSNGRLADCGHPYYRVNWVRAWTQLSGHREGNVLTVQKVCTDCQNPLLAEKLMVSMGMYTIPKTRLLLARKQRREREAAKKKQKDAAA